MKILICLSYCVAPVLTQMILTGKGLNTSSTQPGHGPELAIDDDENTYFLSNIEEPGIAYWQIDLGGYHAVHEIVTTFPNMDSEFAENRTISLSKTSTFEPAHTFLCGQNIAKGTSVLQCEGLFDVQYIRVAIDRPPLALREIVIFGDQAGQSVSKVILTGKGLNTSSTQPGHGPELAIDDDENTYFLSNIAESGIAYWQIDLGGYYAVHEIVTTFPNMDSQFAENRTISLSKNSTFEPAHAFLCGQNIAKGTSVLQCDGLFDVQYIRVATDRPPLALREIVIYGGQAGQSVSKDKNSEASLTGGTPPETITATTTLTTALSSVTFPVTSPSVGPSTESFPTSTPKRATDTFPVTSPSVGPSTESVTTSTPERASDTFQVTSPLVGPSTESFPTSTPKRATDTFPVTSPSVGPSPESVTTSTPERASVGTSSPTVTTTTQGATSGSAFRVIPGYTLETPTATLTTPTVTMCSMCCQQSPGCTAFSFNKALKINNCKTSASQNITLSSGWTANVKGSVMVFRQAGYSCTMDGI